MNQTVSLKRSSDKLVLDIFEKCLERVSLRDV